MTGLSIQFNKLQSTIHSKPGNSAGTLHSTKNKNRYANEDMLPCKLCITEQTYSNLVNLLLNLDPILMLNLAIEYSNVTSQSRADDKSRCRLSTIPGESGSDYINASHINVSTLVYCLIGCDVV